MYLDETRPNAPTLETQNKVRSIIQSALNVQKKLYFTNAHIKSEPAVIDVLGYMVDHVPGTKRVLYSLPEFVGDNYSAMYHLSHAKPLHFSVQHYLKKVLKFLAPNDTNDVNGASEVEKVADSSKE